MRRVLFSGTNWKGRRAWIGLTLLILVSMACQVAGSSTHPVSSPSKDVQPVEKENLPPILMETQPPDGGTILPAEGVVFYFDQQMDKESVISALSMQPQIPGRFEWKDNRTIKWTPEGRLPPAAKVLFSINKEARAAGGMNLAADLELSLETGASLKVNERIPAPGSIEQNPTSPVMVTFNQAVMPLGADAQSFTPAFSLQPPVTGRGEWLNTSSYIFYPEPTMASGAEVTVRLNPNLTSSAGMSLDPTIGTEDWVFGTAQPAVLGIFPETEVPVDLDAPFSLTFNQPMNPTSVEENFHLHDKEGNEITGSFEWDEQPAKVRFTPKQLLPRGATVFLTLDTGALSAGGSALPERLEVAFSTTPVLDLLRSDPANGSIMDNRYSYNTVILEFNAPLKRQPLKEQILFKPAIAQENMSLSQDGRTVYISGFFSSDTRYSLTISPGLLDRWGMALGRTIRLSFTTSPPEPSLIVPAQFAGSRTLFVPPDRPVLTAQAANLNSITVNWRQINLQTYFKLQDLPYGDLPPVELPEYSHRVHTGLPRNVSRMVEIPTVQSGDKLATGIYHVQFLSSELVSQEYAQQPQPFLLISSDVQLTIKRGQGTVVVWATHLSDGQPLADTELALLNGSNQVIGKGMTNAAGLATFALPESLGSDQRIYITSGMPGESDFAFGMDSWTSGVEAWDFDLPSESSPEPLKTYLYTDRPIYRPGQQVNLRLIVRKANNGRYSLPDIQQVKLTVYGEYDYVLGSRPTIATLHLPLSRYGTASGSVSLPEDAQPGYYSIETEDAGFVHLGFQVAEYRKPEFELKVDLPQDDLQPGDKFLARIRARYYFGGPVSDLPVHWTLYASPSHLDLLEGFHSGSTDMGWTTMSTTYSEFGQLGTYLTEGKGETDRNGYLDIEISNDELQALMHSSDRQQLTLEVTGEENSGRSVSSRASILVHSADFYIGIRPESWIGQSGQPFGMAVVSVDRQKVPSGERDIHAEFQEVTWVEAEAFDISMGISSIRPEYKTISNVDLRTDTLGRARIEFIPPQPGTYRVLLTGGGGTTDELLWVSGPGQATWPRLPNQHLRLTTDSPSYNPGQTARVFFPNLFGETGSALLTVERGRVMQSQVIQVSGTGYEWELPLTDDDAPNVYLSVTLLGRRSQDGAPDFRMGYINLPVTPVAQTLKVTMVPDPVRTVPGAEVRFNMQVTDNQGNPVKGEFSLSVVDKAVLALADPNAEGIAEAFYGNQPLGVRTSTSLAGYGGRIALMPIGGLGGAGDGLATPSVREKFADTAFWNGMIETDSNGRAFVDLKLPDNLTTWSALFRGLTGDTLVGEASGEVVTSKALMVRPVTPGFLVAGDHVRMGAWVHNNSGTDLDVDVNLQSTGFRLDDPGAQTQLVHLQTGTQVQVGWWGTVLPVEKVDMVFGASAGTLEDAATPEQGPLPVLRYQVPRTYAANGVLSEPGEKLEIISLPASFNPDSGRLDLEIAPSLAATILSGLKAMKTYPTDFTEPVLSRLFANLSTNQVIIHFRLDAPSLKAELEKEIKKGLENVLGQQNDDGGWGWVQGNASDDLISTYAMLALGEAKKQGFHFNDDALQRCRQFLENKTGTGITETWQYDRRILQLFALWEAGYEYAPAKFLPEKDFLNPWSKALLSILLHRADPTDPRAASLLSEVLAEAHRSGSGAMWQDGSPSWRNYSSPLFNTAIVAMALAEIDPASQLLIDATRKLVLERNPMGGWNSSYESAWVLKALSQVLAGTADLQSDYTYSASINRRTIVEGRASGPDSLTAVGSSLPISDLYPGSSNALRIQHGPGNGRLYYRSFLQLFQPAGQARPLEHGLILSRSYHAGGTGCTRKSCPAINTVPLAAEGNGSVLVRLTLTLPEDGYTVVVEDTIPAGTEILDTSLKTSQQGLEVYNPAEWSGSLQDGWGWWWFGKPSIYHDRIRWVAEYLPAGTYQLVYRLLPIQTGEFQVIPAHAYQYYFPDVEGASAGNVLTITD